MQERDGSADAAGDVEVASLQEPAHEAQCVAADASAAERIMAALPFPDCADVIRCATQITLNNCPLWAIVLFLDGFIAERSSGLLKALASTSLWCDCAVSKQT